MRAYGEAVAALCLLLSACSQSASVLRSGEHDGGLGGMDGGADSHLDGGVDADDDVDGRGADGDPYADVGPDAEPQNFCESIGGVCRGRFMGVPCPEDTATWSELGCMAPFEMDGVCCLPASGCDAVGGFCTDSGGCPSSHDVFTGGTCPPDAPTCCMCRRIAECR